MKILTRIFNVLLIVTGICWIGNLVDIIPQGWGWTFTFFTLVTLLILSIVNYKKNKGTDGKKQNNKLNNDKQSLKEAKKNGYFNIWIYYFKQTDNSKSKFGQSIWNYRSGQKVHLLEIEFVNTYGDSKTEEIELLMVTRKPNGDIYLLSYSDNYSDFEEQIKENKTLDKEDKEFERDRIKEYLEELENDTSFKLKDIKRLSRISTYDLETGEDTDIQDTDENYKYPEIDKIKFLEDLGIQFNERMLKANK